MSGVLAKSPRPVFLLPQAKAKRALFGLGHMCGYGADTVDAARVPGITLEAALQLFLRFFSAKDPGVKSYALQALGVRNA